MTKGGTHWRAKFRVEKRGGGSTPRSHEDKRLVKRQAKESHKGRWLVCDLYRGDDINAPLKFFKELGRIQKTHADELMARAFFWRLVRDSITDVSLDLADDFDSADVERVMVQIKAVVKWIDLDPTTPPASLVADPVLYPPEAHPRKIDPVLEREADKFTEEEFRKNNL